MKETIDLLGGKKITIESHVNVVALHFSYLFMHQNDYQTSDFYYEDLIKLATALLKMADVMV